MAATIWFVRGLCDNDKVTHVCCNKHDVMRGIWDIDNVVGTGCWASCLNTGYWASCFGHGLFGFVLWARAVALRVVGTFFEVSCCKHELFQFLPEHWAVGLRVVVNFVM